MNTLQNNEVIDISNVAETYQDTCFKLFSHRRIENFS